MDKASILGDAISYVQDLKKQAKEIQAEIEGLRSNLSRHGNDSTGFNRDHPVVYGVENGNSAATPIEAPTAPTLYVNVSKVQTGAFHLSIYCKKNPGVLVRLMRALESTQLDFHNHNITSSDGHIIETAIVKMKKRDGLMEADAVRGVIVDATSNHGFKTP